MCGADSELDDEDESAGEDAVNFIVSNILFFRRWHGELAWAALTWDFQGKS